MRPQFKTSTGILVACFVMLLQSVACDDYPHTGKTTCNVTVTLTPARFGDTSSPSGGGEASVVSESQEEALNVALDLACFQLESTVDLDSTAASQCRKAENFEVEVAGPNDTRLISSGRVSWRCISN